MPSIPMRMCIIAFLLGQICNSFKLRAFRTLHHSPSELKKFNSGIYPVSLLQSAVNGSDETAKSAMQPWLIPLMSLIILALLLFELDVLRSVSAVQSTQGEMLLKQGEMLLKQSENLGILVRDVADLKDKQNAITNGIAIALALFAGANQITSFLEGLKKLLNTESKTDPTQKKTK